MNDSIVRVSNLSTTAVEWLTSGHLRDCRITAHGRGWIEAPGAVLVDLVLLLEDYRNDDLQRAEGYTPSQRAFGHRQADLCARLAARRIRGALLGS